MFTMRFGMRSANTDGAARAELYETTVEMVAWAESRGAVAAIISEHHASDDGYLPSPVPMASALAAVTTTIPITVGALLIDFYEPVKLAEDMVVVDLLSRGRVSYVVGIGYRDEEFAMFGIDRRTRGRLAEERIGIVKRLFAGETVDVDGRRARITPLPFTPGGPMIGYGGGTEAAARRAGRLGMMFLAERPRPELEAAYLDEAAKAGVTPAGCMIPVKGVPMTVFVADDPDKAWAEVGPYMLVDALGYGAWNQGKGREDVAAVSFATTVDELRAENGYFRILTPEEARAMVASGLPLPLQPTVGGIPSDVAWRYLEAAAAISG